MRSADQAPPPSRSRLDSFLAGLFLTPEGRPKSAKMLYSFFLSLVFMAVYGVCYWFLIDPLEAAFAASSALVRNLFESIVPGLTGSILCCAFHIILKDKSYLLFTYIWLLVFALAALISLLILTERESIGMMLQLYGLLVPVGLVSGFAFSLSMYLRWRAKDPAARRQKA